MGRRLGITLAVALVGCSTRVTGGLDESSANEAVTVLEEHGIPATKAQESGSGEARFAIEAPRGDLGDALSVLRSVGLPRTEDPGIAETYREASLVPSETEERARWSSAIAGELARTLERVDGVVDARVHLAVPTTDPLLLDAPAPPARASVLITTRGTPALDEPAIRALVAGAVDGLSPDSVAVVTVAARGERHPSRLARLGPFRVAPGTFGPLAILLGISLGIHVAMATSLLYVTRRRKPDARERIA